MCHGVVGLLVVWQWWGVTVAVVAATGVPWHCQGGNVTKPLHRGVVGVLGTGSEGGGGGRRAAVLWGCLWAGSSGV